MLKIAMSLASLVASGAFIWASVGLRTVPHIWYMAIVDYYMLAYGISTVVLLALAWFRGRLWQVHATAILGASLLCGALFTLFAAGMTLGHKAALLAVVSTAILINWTATRTAAAPFGSRVA